ncbi:aldo/keto reductase [Streptomyces cyaneofuscatus]
MRTVHPRVVLGLHRSRHERSLLTEAADLGVDGIDTSSNYLGFQSHRVLAETAGDLLSRFAVSTKIGYFPAGSASEHSLNPDRLSSAVEDAARDLGREPNLVFLHNPEHSIAHLSKSSASKRLGAACSVLVDATVRGLCGAWGISTWDPRPLSGLTSIEIPRPDVLMVRSGLLVGAEILHAADVVAARLRPTVVWGMSPFGGNGSDLIWQRFDPRVFMHTPERCTPMQAAFRTAFHLPTVNAVAMGTNKASHLHELTKSMEYPVDLEAVSTYRDLLRRGHQRD